MINSNPPPSQRGGARPGAGRPKRIGLARALRDKFPPTRITAMVEKLASSEDENIQKWAVEFLSNRTEGKTPDRVELGPAGSMDDDPDEIDLNTLTLEQRRELLELERHRERILALAAPIDAGPADT